MDLKGHFVLFLVTVTFLLPTGSLISSSGSFVFHNVDILDLGSLSGKIDIENLESGAQIRFIENKGQWDDEILYQTETPFGYSIVMEDGFILGFRNMDDDLVVVKYEFMENMKPGITGHNLFPTKYNYIRSHDPSSWRIGVQAFEEIYLENVWRGIDLKLYSEDGRLKYDLLVQPGSDVNDIGFRVHGVDHLEFDGEYLDLGISELGTISDGPLLTYQGNKDMPCESMVSVKGKNEFGFIVGEYDHSRKLVIDPILAGNFIGGWGYENVNDMVLDGKGNQFMTGYTTSTDFPVTPGVYQNHSKGGKEVFVCKADMNGTSLHYATYIGGREVDEGRSIDVDDQGNAFVTGFTESLDFPVTSGALDPDRNGSYEEGFLIKLDPRGEDLLFSTFLGGSQQDIATSVIVAEDGDVVVAGYTLSEDYYYTSGAYKQPLPGTKDGFISRITNDGSEFVYSFIFGGPSAEMCTDLMELPDGSLVVCGNTTSYEFPMTSNSYDPNYNDFDDVFVVRFSEDGSNILSSTFLGGDNYEQATAMDTDDSGSIYVTGQTYSIDFPTTEGSFQEDWSSAWDPFVVKFDINLSRLVYSTFLSSGENEWTTGIKVDRIGRAHVIGRTYSKYFPTTWGAYQEDVQGEGDVFMTILDQNASDLEYSTIIGGARYDFPASLALDDQRNVYITGWTISGDFPHRSIGYGPNILGFNDGFSICLNLSLPPSEPHGLNGDKGEMNFNVTWEPPVMDYGLDILNYRLIKWIGNATGGALTYWLPGSVTFFNDTDVFIGQTYHYKVCAKTIAGIGNYSKEYIFYNYIEPSTPLNLEVDYDGLSICVQWDPPSKGGGTKVRNYSLNKEWDGGQNTFMLEALENSNQFMDDNITKGVTYTYAVSAWNGYHWSQEVQGSIRPRTTPSPPLYLNVTEGSGYAYLDWIPPSDLGGAEIIGYHIYRGMSEGNETLFTTMEGKETFYNDTTVVNGLSYVYYIRAINEIGISDPGNADRADPTGVPFPPWKLTSRERENSVMLLWDPPITDGGSLIHTYQVYRYETGIEPYLYYEVNGSTLNFIDISVEPNSIYFYYVIAISDLGVSDPSEIVHVTLEGYPTPPRDIILTRGDGFVNIEWSPPSDNGYSSIREYRIYRKVEDGSYSLLSEVLSQFQSYNDTSIENGELYFYRVTAINDKGESKPSVEDSTMPVGVPYHPMNLHAESEEHFIQLSWSAPIDDGGVRIVKYLIYRGPTPESLSFYTEVYTADLKFKDMEVRIGLDYYYYVIANNGKYNSPKSQMVKGIPKGLPGAAENLTSTKIEEGVRLTWEPPTNTGGTEIIYYQIFRKAGTGDFTLIGKLSGSAFILDDLDLDEPGQYSYYIIAENEIGIGPRTDYIYFTVEEESHQGDGPWKDFRSYAFIFLGISFLVLIIAGLMFLRRRSRGEYDQVHADDNSTVVDGGSEEQMEDVDPHQSENELYEDPLIGGSAPPYHADGEM